MVIMSENIFDKAVNISLQGNKNTDNLAVF